MLAFPQRSLQTTRRRRCTVDQFGFYNYQLWLKPAISLWTDKGGNKVTLERGLRWWWLSSLRRVGTEVRSTILCLGGCLLDTARKSYFSHESTAVDGQTVNAECIQSFWRESRIQSPFLMWLLTNHSPSSIHVKAQLCCKPTTQQRNITNANPFSWRAFNDDNISPAEHVSKSHCSLFSLSTKRKV